LYDDHRRVTQMTKATLIPSVIQWHPGDAVVLVCSADGDIQVKNCDKHTGSLQFKWSPIYPLVSIAIMLDSY